MISGLAEDRRPKGCGSGVTNRPPSAPASSVPFKFPYSFPTVKMDIDQSLIVRVVPREQVKFTQFKGREMFVVLASRPRNQIPGRDVANAYI